MPISKKKAAEKKAAEKKKTAEEKRAGRATVVKTDASSYLKDLIALRGKDEPPGFSMLDQALYGIVTDRISTGSLALDKMLGGGWPEGRITEVAGWEGVGKSSLLDQAAAQCQAMGGIVALIDSERARDLKYSTALGVNVSECILGDVDDIEGGFELIDKVLTVQEAKRIELEKVKRRVPPMLVMWDSIGGTPARVELLGAPDDSHVTPAARAISHNFRRIVVSLNRNRVTLVFANHFYTKIGGFGGLSTYGGKGVRYYPSVRLWLSRTGHLTVGDQVIGHTVKAKLRKTRVGPPQPDQELGFVHTGGFSNTHTLFEWGVAGGESSPKERWIETRGTHRYLRPPGKDPIHFQRGLLGLSEILTSEPDIYAAMVASYRDEEKAA